MATTHRILPPTPDLDQLRRGAKELLKALQAGDPSARARVHAVARGLPVRLSTAQVVVAREHGVDSWPQLKELVDRVVAQGTRYDVIGQGYAAYRRPDPRIDAAVRAALGDARTVLNVGAGTGSYEPTDRPVLALEPSTAMAEQRPAHCCRPCAVSLRACLSPTSASTPLCDHVDPALDRLAPGSRPSCDA